MTETWFVMADGSVGDPAEVTADASGVLRHKDGRAVALAPHGPRSRSVDAEAERAKARVVKPVHSSPVAAPEPEKPEEPKPVYVAAEMKPETPKRGYTTRQGKAG